MILAISGSTRDDSTNHHLINAIAALTSEKFVVTLVYVTESVSSTDRFAHPFPV
jgi:NAD(P)H-dependent FMN reductase